MTSQTLTPGAHYLDECGGCPVCDAGHVLQVEPDGTAWLCDLHYADQAGTFEHDEAVSR